MVQEDFPVWQVVQKNAIPAMARARESTQRTLDFARRIKNKGGSKMKISTITFTGADDKTNIGRLHEISALHPFVEWGILFSRTQEGSPRFPSLEWMRIFAPPSGIPMNLSAHLCGGWLRELLAGAYHIPEGHSTLLGYFNRVQLNFHDESQTFGTQGMYLMKAMNKDFIFQIDGTNTHIYRYMKDKEVRAFPFFDLSHGAGHIPETWDSPLDETYCGYAGGLGPHNLEQQLHAIEGVVGDRSIWVDMETHVRTNGEFDLDKVQQCIDIARRWA